MGFFSTVVTDTYDGCIDKNFPREDPTDEICWPDVSEHECQFCTKLGYESNNENTDFKIQGCELQGYKIEPCLDAEVQHKVETEVMCKCDTPNQGRVGKN